MSEHLPTIGYISHIVANALRDPTSGINTTQLRAEPNGCVSEALVSRSDALAKLAEKDVEIARLRDNLARTLEIAMSRAEGTTCTHLVRQAFSLAKTTGMSADDVVQTVLGDLFPIMKGPEA